MGMLATAVSLVGALMPERKTIAGAQIPTWEQGKPQNARFWHNYWRFALEGYGRSELVYSCVEELATSAAEPRLLAMRKNAKGKAEAIPDHPVLDLFEHPNKWTSRYALIASLIMYRAVSGNAYLNLGRSAAGKVVQLWALRPDRVFVVPDAETYIDGWDYKLEGNPVQRIEPEDLIQFKTRNPLDDWYGLPPLAVCAERVDTDALMRSFTLAFFRNAGVPAGLLNITKQVTTAEKQLIRDRLRGETGGPQNWHQMLVLDNTEATYTPMGMPLGASGIVLPELDEISEARIGMAFGIPLELIGARLGLIHGNRSTMDAARAHFWEETCIPLYQELGADLTRGLQPEYAGTPDEFDYLEFDLSTVRALQEDDDAKAKRYEGLAAAGIVSIQEARVALGHEPEFEKDALLILARGLEPMAAANALLGAPPAEQQPGGGAVLTRDPQAADEAAGQGQGQPKPGKNGQNGNGSSGKGKGRVTAADLAALKELAAGRDLS